MALPAIELQNLGVVFEGHEVLKNVSLSIHEGESIVLIGPSGRGKSVLIKVMAGLIPPTTGAVLVRGESLPDLTGTARQRVINRFGMLFQRNALFDSLTCQENIAFPLREVTDLSEVEIKKTVEFFLEAVGIAHAKNLYPDEISGGMQKRLGIARALALNPEVIFYDDPTAGLDPITSRKIIDLILNLRKQNKSTLVTITNDMNRAYQLADQILMVIDQGVVVAGTVAETQQHQDPRIHQFITGALDGPLTSGAIPS